MTMNSRMSSREIKPLRLAQMMMSIAPEQYDELIISHITRRLDLNDDKLDELINGASKGKSSIANFTKASLRRIASPFQTTKSKMGSEKDDRFRCHGVEVSGHYMDAINKLIASLSSDSELEVEGVFRKSGNCARVKELKQKIMEDWNVDLAPYTTHDRANALKHLLRDMPEPLLLSRHLEAFSQAIALRDSSVETGSERCLRVMQLLILHLPRNNALVARRLLSLLSRVVKEPANKMDTAALATVFSPHLLCSKQLQADAVLFNNALSPATAVIKFLINNSTRVFLVPVEFSRDVAHFLRSECADRLPPEKGTPESSSPLRDAYGSVLSPVSTLLTFSAHLAHDIRNTTELELAKLHAHVQAMPEEARRKLSKQLNHVEVMAAITPTLDSNTPRQCRHEDTPSKRFRSKSLSASIKKRLPMFRSKSKYPAVASDHSVSLTGVDIDFEETPSNTVVDCKPAGQSSVKRAADSPTSSSPLLITSNHPRLGSGDVTPPKVACKKEGGGRMSPFVGIAPRARQEHLGDTPAPPVKDRKQEAGTPLPSIENEREYLVAPDPRDRLLKQVLSPVQHLNDTDLPTREAQQSHWQSWDKSRESRRPQSAVHNMETSL